MYSILKLFIIIIISYVLISFIFNKIEHYITLTVGYNNISVPNYTIPNIFDNDISQINSIFKNLIKDENFDKTNFKEHNPNIPFPLTEQIKLFILNYLHANINRMRGHDIVIPGNFNNLYYKDIENDRIFIFNTSVIDNTRFISINLQVKIKIKNIKDFLQNYDKNTVEENINYIQIIQNNVDIELLSLRIDEQMFAKFTYSGIDSLQPNMYQLKNRLSLMHPYITSNKDMTIT
jgi:hypothetical protein